MLYLAKYSHLHLVWMPQLNSNHTIRTQTLRIFLLKFEYLLEREKARSDQEKDALVEKEKLKKENKGFLLW